MPGEHAKLSPSDAERWISCPAAIGMDEKFAEEESSEYAEEGTAAHAWAELKARHRILKNLSDGQYQAEYVKWAEEFGRFVETDDDWAEMDRHTTAYVDFLKERLALHPNSILLLEQRLNTGVPSSWGTSDAVIVSPVHIEIDDFKYGAGIRISALKNPQTRLYACGALDEFGDLLGETELVTIGVFQPRMNNVDSETLSPADLRAWRAEVAIPAAELALGPDAPFGPSDEACRWCPASGQCQAQLEAVFAVADFEEDPKVLTPEQMAEVQDKIKMIRDWANAFEVALLHAAYSEGKHIPGYKVVLSGGQRGVRDPDRAREVLLEAKYAPSDFLAPQKIRGIGELEKLLGKDQFKTLLEDTGIVTKSDGKPAIAHESDSRPAIDPNTEAQKEFSE